MEPAMRPVRRMEIKRDAWKKKAVERAIRLRESRYLVTHRLRLTELSFLTPPTLRSVGRFMSISKLAKWGEKILKLLRDKKKIQAFRIVRRLRDLVPGLGRYRLFIRRFKNVCDKVDHFLSI